MKLIDTRRKSGRRRPGRGDVHRCRLGWIRDAAPGVGCLTVSLTLAFSALGSPAFAAVPEAESAASLATLEGALAYAQANHPALQAVRLEREAEEAMVPQARSLPDPTLSLQVATMERRVGVGASQMIPLAGRRGLQGAVAEEGARAASRMVEARALEVAAGVVNAFSELAYLVRAQVLMTENLRLVEGLEQVALARYRTGESPFADVVRAQVEVARVEDELRSLREVEEAAVASLNAAMGRAAGAPLPLPEGVPPVSVEPSDEEVLRGLEERNPELGVLRHQAAAAGHRLEIARRNGTPDLMVGVELMHSGEMNRTGLGAMVGINLPIWRERRVAEIRETGARAAAAAAREAEAGLSLEAEARMAMFRYRDAGRRAELYEVRLIPQAEQSLAATQAAYRTGEATFGEVVETARLALEFRLTLERVRAERLQQAAELDRLTGRGGIP